MPRPRSTIVYQRRKAAGLCVGCGLAPQPGKVRCLGCAARQQRYQALCRVHPARLTQGERVLLLEDAQALGLEVRSQSPDVVRIGQVDCDWPLLAGIVAGLLRQRAQHTPHTGHKEREQ